MKRYLEIKLDNLFVSLSPKGPVLYHRRRARGNRRLGVTISPINDHEKAMIVKQHPEIAKQFNL